MSTAPRGEVELWLHLRETADKAAAPPAEPSSEPLGLPAALDLLLATVRDYTAGPPGGGRHPQYVVRDFITALEAAGFSVLGLIGFIPQTTPPAPALVQPQTHLAALAAELATLMTPDEDDADLLMQIFSWGVRRGQLKALGQDDRASWEAASELLDRGHEALKNILRHLAALGLAPVEAAAARPAGDSASACREEDDHARRG